MLNLRKSLKTIINEPLPTPYSPIRFYWAALRPTAVAVVHPADHFRPTSLDIDGDGFKVDFRDVVSHNVRTRVCGVAGAGEDVAEWDVELRNPT